MELLIALIPVLPLAGFLFAVFVGPRLDLLPAPHGEHAEDHAAEADHATHELVDESAYRSIPTEPEQARTSPHAGHADALSNANGADGVIPPELNDGLGQAGHVVPGGR